MADMMTFPDTWEEFEEQYGITDREQIYTNGARLIPSFRVKQWLDHIADRKTEPQTNANQHVQRVEYVGNDEKSRCWTCKHFERMHETPIASDGNYYTYVVCTAKECHYEPQTEKPNIWKRIDKPFRAVWLDDDHNEIGTPQTEREGE